MYINNNWILKKYIDCIQVLPNDFRERFLMYNIPIIEYETFIDWEKIKPNYSFMYDYEGNELEIAGFLKQSALTDYQHVLLYIDSDISIIEVETKTFIDNWEDFVASNGFTGIVVFTNDGKFFAEFTDDSQWKLYSNFLIKTAYSEI
jgi:hypothetical protein